jgi:hypothetical protein
MKLEKMLEFTNTFQQILEIEDDKDVTLLNLSSRVNRMCSCVTQSSARLSFRSGSQILSPLLLALLCIVLHGLPTVYNYLLYGFEYVQQVLSPNLSFCYTGGEAVLFDSGFKRSSAEGTGSIACSGCHAGTAASTATRL